MHVSFRQSQTVLLVFCEKSIRRLFFVRRVYTRMFNGLARGVGKRSRNVDNTNCRTYFPIFATQSHIIWYRHIIRTRPCSVNKTFANVSFRRRFLGIFTNACSTAKARTAKNEYYFVFNGVSANRLFYYYFYFFSFITQTS